MEFVALRVAYYCVNAASSFVCFTILLTGSNIQFHFTVKKKNRFELSGKEQKIKNQIRIELTQETIVLTRLDSAV